MESHGRTVLPCPDVRYTHTHKRARARTHKRIPRKQHNNKNNTVLCACYVGALGAISTGVQLSTFGYNNRIAVTNE